VFSWSLQAVGKSELARQRRTQGVLIFPPRPVDSETTSPTLLQALRPDQSYTWRLAVATEHIRQSAST